MTKPLPPPRISVLTAHGSRTAVILRRGPSRQVLLLRWDLEQDTFEAGQWFKGRIYEHYCDLSPNGEFLVYCAFDPRRMWWGPNPVDTWSAVSRPPYLTALTIWTHAGYSCGGGVFVSDRHLELTQYMRLYPAYPQKDPFPDNFRLTKLAAEDERPGLFGPVGVRRLVRDGWIRSDTSSGAHETWRKANPVQPGLVLTMTDSGSEPHLIGSLPRPVTYKVGGPAHEVVFDLGKKDWADWCPRGDLLYAVEGKIYRRNVDLEPSSTEQLIDLCGLRFVEREPPAEAKRWDGPRPRGETLVRTTRQG
jgi:hypothetical protein